ncbi:MAG: ABC transporter ATP-binding protein [Acidobacteriota bacterium]|nr:ABC transporter ATP-binding protein [Acidobacteriota bacterium]
MNAAITASDLSKKYRIRATDQAYYSTLRESLMSAGRTALGFALGRGFGRSSAPAEFWSLDGLSFEVQPGEVVGVIGHNGAGKSTLLRILSRITEPTRGWAEIRGRVGSLLEVGTGFHEELTGRENLFLNGAILGMKQVDIRRRFDAIVDFAELGAFVDTPVKHYSSGMYMRLAFSVAAHLEPDVLLVDEVLAVGDLAFQRKCLAKMEHIAGEGRTVLFVSHNLAAVKELCQTAIVLQNGKLAYRGSSANGVAAYLRLSETETTVLTGGTAWHRLAVNGHAAHEAVAVAAGQPFTLSATLHCDEAFGRGRFSCQLTNASRDLLIEQGVAARDLRLSAIDAGAYEMRVTFPGLWLTPGIYTAWLRFNSEVGSVSRDFDSAPVLINVTGLLEGEGRSVLTAPLDWRIEPVADRAVSA